MEFMCCLLCMHEFFQICFLQTVASNIRSSSSEEEEEEEEELSLVRPSIALSKLDIEVLVFIRLFQAPSRALKSVHFFRIAYCAQVEMLLLLLFFS